jgi:putative DNA primase/helicase
MKKSNVPDVTAMGLSNGASEESTRSTPRAVTNVTQAASSTATTRHLNGFSGFQLFTEPVTVEGSKRTFRPGVWWFGINAGIDTEDDGSAAKRQPIWVCSPLFVKAVTYDQAGNHFGRLLRFRNSIGRVREWAMPMEMLRSSGEEMRGVLLSMGVEINPRARTLLTDYLQCDPPAAANALCTEHWLERGRLCVARRSNWPGCSGRCISGWRW